MNTDNNTTNPSRLALAVSLYAAKVKVLDLMVEYQGGEPTQENFDEAIKLDNWMREILQEQGVTAPHNKVGLMRTDEEYKDLKFATGGRGFTASGATGVVTIDGE